MIKARLASQSGLTLVEIVVVLIIIGVVFAVIAPNVLSSGDKAKARLTNLQIKKLANHIEQFQLQYNTLPNSLSDLTGCPEQAGQSCVPLADENETVDAWGTKFILESQGNRYSIKSLGSDRKRGGQGVEGDIVLEGP